jgi:hypothetical protein
MRYSDLLESDLTDDYFDMSNLNVHSHKSRETLMYISPDDFLTLALPGFEKGKFDRVKSVGDQGTKFRDVPLIMFAHDNKGNALVVGHEGRHRALYLKSKGVEKMPVRFLSIEGPGKGIRWGVSHEDGPDHIPTMPHTITSEDGKNTLPMPTSAIYPGHNKVG